MSTIINNHDYTTSPEVQTEIVGAMANLGVDTVYLSLPNENGFVEVYAENINDEGYEAPIYLFRIELSTAQIYQ